MSTGARIPSIDELELGASRAAAFYMQSGAEHVDRQFGAGYAKAHPELVGAFMTAAATTFQASLQSEGAKDIKEALHEIAANVIFSGDSGD